MHWSQAVMRWGSLLNSGGGLQEILGGRGLSLWENIHMVEKSTTFLLSNLFGAVFGCNKPGKWCLHNQQYMDTLAVRCELNHIMKSMNKVASQIKKSDPWSNWLLSLAKSSQFLVFTQQPSMGSFILGKQISNSWKTASFSHLGYNDKFHDIVKFTKNSTVVSHEHYGMLNSQRAVQWCHMSTMGC